MRVALLCVGRLKVGAERDLALRYVGRAAAAGRAIGIAAVDVREIDESRARRPQDRKAEEARALLVALPPGADFVALDEDGILLASRAFAAELGRRRDSGSDLTLVIGGADGLDGSVRAAASLLLSLGPMTFPHQLVRILAAEQIYRAVTILSGHPYHRD